MPVERGKQRGAGNDRVPDGERAGADGDAAARRCVRGVDERGRDAAAWRWPTSARIRPSVPDAARTLEVHILDFSGDLYGTRCEVGFVERLATARSRFASVDALVAQIGRDAAQARALLALDV